MVRIRLSRTGRKKLPQYRIVVCDGRAPRDGRFLEIIGHYSPIGKKQLEVDHKRYQYWIDHGAQPSKRVTRLRKEC